MLPWHCMRVPGKSTRERLGGLKVGYITIMCRFFSLQIFYDAICILWCHGISHIAVVVCVFLEMQMCVSEHPHYNDSGNQTGVHHDQFVMLLARALFTRPSERFRSPVEAPHGTMNDVVDQGSCKLSGPSPRTQWLTVYCRIQVHRQGRQRASRGHHYIYYWIFFSSTN